MWPRCWGSSRTLRLSGNDSSHVFKEEWGFLRLGRQKAKDSSVYEHMEPERRAWQFGMRRHMGQMRLEGSSGSRGRRALSAQSVSSTARLFEEKHKITQLIRLEPGASDFRV